MTESVFLVVDSDPGDLATFTSVLTSRYGSEYKIRTAATASEAHTTLAALSDAGITVALLIVSRELVEADLFLLLKRARELFPGARRALSARYVDPSAFEFITGAMRSGRIDYFLYKPLRTCGRTALPQLSTIFSEARTRPGRSAASRRFGSSESSGIHAPTNSETSWSVARSPLGAAEIVAPGGCSHRSAHVRAISRQWH